MIAVSSCSLWMEDQLVWSTGPFRISEECVSRLIYLSLESLIRLRKGHCQFTDASVFQTVFSFRSFFVFYYIISPQGLQAPIFFLFLFFFLFMWYFSYNLSIPWISVPEHVARGHVAEKEMGYWGSDPAKQGGVPYSEWLSDGLISVKKVI